MQFVKYVATVVVGLAVLMLVAKILGFNVKTPFGEITAWPELKSDPITNQVTVSGNPDATVTKTLLNSPSEDTVVASCKGNDEVAISGLCTLDKPGAGDSWGWVLQNAGIVDKKSWGCTYRRSAYITPKDGTSGQSEKDEKPREADPRIAASRGSASATASVLCLQTRQ